MPTLAAVHSSNFVDLIYLLAAVCFILGLKLLSKVKTASRGNLVSALGMLIAICTTFFYISGGEAISLVWIAIGLLIGSAIGAVLALRVQMTAMPQMVGMFNGFGGIASLLVACGDYAKTYHQPLGFANEPWHQLLAIGLTTLVGGVTFTGSMVAFGKLQGLKITPSKPIQFPGQKPGIVLMLLVSLALSFYLIVGPTFWIGVIIIGVLSLILGVMLVIGIGGADMPVVISLLNAYSGIAGALAGFVLGNFALIVTGALVGASGIILTNIMCKAMNRSLMNVLFGGVGGAVAGGGVRGDKSNVHEFSVEDAAMVLDAAQNVIVVPGYGMAVAQAQHAVKDLADQLEKRNIDVKYAIHPVAGRMPGHMNVLLAEAGVPYEQLLDLEQINPEFDRADVALVIGANDVTNPAARDQEDSPIYGMPILDVDKARTVFVIKRSLSPGFAGIDNALYYQSNTGMIFGDAKKIATGLGQELSEI